jgi:carboxylate-amine ligase
LSETAGSGDYRYPLGLFGGYGIELEYMIVDRETLDVRPVADELFRLATGRSADDPVSDVELDGEIAWSNELALHVVELKTDGPTALLDGVADKFQSHVERIDGLLAPLGCRLLPTGMHPWMDPDRESRLWPHEHNETYRTFDRIFGCKGHGWSNLQSTHINLPFADDEEFGRLHAAIRLVLPLLPALAASTPFVDGLLSPHADHRLEVYRQNSKRIPSVTGLVVPEPVFTRAAYERDILGRIYEDTAPFDPDGVLRHEFANARGCIARFDRGAIEIRVLDIQECPRADLGVVTLVAALVRALVDEQWITLARQRAVEPEPLHAVLLDVIRYGERARITDPALLDVLGFDPRRPKWAGDLWRELARRVLRGTEPYADVAFALVDAGSLSSRIAARVRTPRPERDVLRALYAELADCLAQGRLFGIDG